MIGRLWCLLNRHRPKRHRVRSVANKYYGTCRFCDQPIEREHHRVWVVSRGRPAG